MRRGGRGGGCCAGTASPRRGPRPRGCGWCPSPTVWREIPSWDWHRAGAEAVRARTIVNAAWHAAKLEAAATSAERGPAAARAARDRRVDVGRGAAARPRRRRTRSRVGDFHLAIAGRLGADRPEDRRRGHAAAAGSLPGAPAPGHRLLELGGVRPPRSRAADARARLPVVLRPPLPTAGGGVRAASRARRGCRLRSAGRGRRRRRGRGETRSFWLLRRVPVRCLNVCIRQAFTSIETCLRAPFSRTDRREL